MYVECHNGQVLDLRILNNCLYIGYVGGLCNVTDIVKYVLFADYSNICCSADNQNVT